MTGRGLALAGAGMLALAASIGIHLSAASIGIFAEPEVRMAGGEAMPAAALGSSFETLVAAGDRLSPVNAEPRTAAVADDHIAEPAEAAISPVAVAPVSPSAMDAPQSLRSAGSPEIAAVAPVQTIDVVEARPDELVLPVPLVRPFRQIDVDRARAEERRRAARAAERQRQAEQQRQAERQRQADRQRRAQQQQQRSTRQQAQGTQQGQANRNARAGRADEQAQGHSGNTRQGDRPAREVGNAAATNYPGKVYAKIRRTRQRAAGGRGTVRVSFSIGGSGGLAGVSVAASSGSAAVDRAAVDHIRRAAPFPAPPPGAQRRFVIPIEIRR